MRIRKFVREKILESGGVGQRDIATHKAHKFGAKLDAVILVCTKEMSQFVGPKQLGWV